MGVRRVSRSPKVARFFSRKRPLSRKCNRCASHDPRSSDRICRLEETRPIGTDLPAPRASGSEVSFPNSAVANQTCGGGFRRLSLRLFVDRSFRRSEPPISVVESIRSLDSRQVLFKNEIIAQGKKGEEACLLARRTFSRRATEGSKAARKDDGEGRSKGEWRVDRFLKQPQYLTATAHGRGFGATCFTTLRRPSRISRGGRRRRRRRDGRNPSARVCGNCTMPVDTPPISEHQSCSTPSLCFTLARTLSPPSPRPSSPVPQSAANVEF